MSHVSDAQRAIEPRVHGDPGLLPLADILGPRPPQRNVREAALTLGRVFKALEGSDRRLGDWALPHQKTLGDERTFEPRLDRALQQVYGKDEPSIVRVRAYDADLDAVLPALRNSAVSWGVATLANQVQVLDKLRLEVAHPVFKVWMHQVADEIVKGSWGARAADARLVLSGKQSALRAVGQAETLATSRNLRIRQSAMRVETQALARPFPMVVELRRQFVADLRVLRAVKQYPDIVEAYQRSADEGTALLQTLITTASEAIGSFSDSIASSKEHVWRYPALIVGGLQALGLDTLPDVKDFFLAFAAAQADNRETALLNLVGAGLLVIGLLSPPGAVGTLVADFLFGGVSAVFAYLKEHERDLAMRASLFFPDEQKFAIASGYGETAIAVGFMLVAGYTLLRGLLKKPPVRVSPGSESGVPSPGKPSARPTQPAATPVATPQTPNLPRQDVIDFMLEQPDTVEYLQRTYPLGEATGTELGRLVDQTARGVTAASKAASSAFDAFAAYGLRDKAIGFIKLQYTIDMTRFSGRLTSLGYPRNSRAFWRAMLDEYSFLFSKKNRALIEASRAPRVDPTWLKYHRSQADYLGDILVHHHVEQGPWAAGIPEGVHHEFYSELHPITNPDILE